MTVVLVMSLWGSSIITEYFKMTGAAPAGTFKIRFYFLLPSHLTPKLLQIPNNPSITGKPKLLIFVPTPITTIPRPASRAPPPSTRPEVLDDKRILTLLYIITFTMFRQLSKTTFRQMAYVHHPRATCPPGTKIRSVRRFHRAPVAYARKDTQHKDSLKPDRAEYSQSGGDDAAAKTEKAAFDPNQTRPEHEEPTAKQESGGTDVSDAGNPLNVSPGNKDVSEAQPDKQQQSHRSTSESGQGSSRGRTSGSGGAPKAGGGKSG